MAARTKSEPPSHTTHIVRNQSSRNGRNVSAVAVHSTESADQPGTTADLTAAALLVFFLEEGYDGFFGGGKCHDPG